MDILVRDDPNRLMLLRVATALGALREELVFVGGCATGLLITAVRAEAPRPTYDVDTVAEITSVAGYHALERKLAAKGFMPDTSPDAPICRRVKDDIRLDVVPSAPEILGFGNRWYTEVLASSSLVTLAEGISIHLISAPLFLATKLEAFKDRGNNDYLASHDLEDLLAVVDGREELMMEIAGVSDDLLGYLVAEFSLLLNEPDFIAALPGQLPADSGAQLRFPDLIARLNEIAGLKQ